MERIPLPGGYYTLIDSADEQLIAGFPWRILKQRSGLYVHAWHFQMHIYMHRLIVGAPDGSVVDHVNRDGLDNRRANLRVATSSQNGANRIADRRVRRKTSDYKGVFFDSARQRWSACIHINGRSRALGRFTTEVEAAAAYNRAATEAWGRFARLNLIDDQRDQ